MAFTYLYYANAGDDVNNRFTKKKSTEGLFI